MAYGVQKLVTQVINVLEEYNDLEDKEIAVSIRVVLDRWRSFKDIPVFRENLELAENMLESGKYFHTIYEMITGEKIDKTSPNERYLNSQTLAGAMMVNVHPSLLGFPVYKYALNNDVLVDMYSNTSNQIIYSVASLIWAYMYPNDMEVKPNMGSIQGL